MDVREALQNRVSIRAYTDEAVSEDAVRAILDDARYAPSGGNLQPWKVVVVTGEAKDEACRVSLEAMMANMMGEADEFPIYPEGLKEPYRGRRTKVGEDMYALLGIPREDKAARLTWLQNNFRFFGAPVGMFFVIDRDMGRGQWAHLGMFMQSVALAVTAHGYASCMQEAWAMVRKTLYGHFELPDNEVLYAGMAIGRADPDASVNTLRSDRESVDAFARFEGF